MSCQSGLGGFSKFPKRVSDVMHSHFGLAGLALMGFNEEVKQAEQGHTPYFSNISWAKKQ